MDNNVNLNYDKVKDEFVNFLHDSGKAIQWNTTDVSEMNIFDCSDEFREYLDEKYSDVDILNFSKMMESISEMKLENGKLVTVSDVEDAEESEDTEEDDDFMIDYLNDLLDSEEFRDYIDKNHNGVEKEEIIEFLNSVKTKKALEEGELDPDVSFDNVIEQVGNIKNSNSSTPKTMSLDTQPLELDTSDKSQGVTIAPSLSSGGTGAYTSTGGSVPTVTNYSTGSGGKTTGNIEVNTNNYMGMDMDTLKGYQSEYSKKEEDALINMGYVIRGEDSEVQSANKDVVMAADEYKEALGFAQGDDSYKDSDTMEAKIAQCIDTITNADGSIELYTTQMSETQIKINSLTTERDSIQAEIDGMQAAYDKNALVLTAKQTKLQGISPTIKNSEGQDIPNPDYTSLAQEISELNTSQIKLKGDIDSKTNNDLKSKNDEIQQEQDKYDDYEQKKKDAEEEREQAIKEKEELEAQLSEEKQQAIQEAKEKFDTAQITYEKVYQEQYDGAKSDYDKCHGELQKINEAINAQKTKDKYDELKVDAFDFDYTLNMNSSQSSNLDAFMAHWEANKDRYEALSERLGGFPAELIAAIHWREGSGNFNTYLHNGQPLGQTTTIVPVGIYFDNWEDAAIDALSNHGTGLNGPQSDDVTTWFEYAERYNGLGYRNKGVASPYVWAGTEKYTGGMYVRDGVYDASAYDNRVGVAAMVYSILS